MIYPRRYISEPRKRLAYEDACDLIAIYGISRKHWNYKVHHLSRSEMKDVWNTAEIDMKGKSIYDFAYGKGSR